MYYTYLLVSQIYIIHSGPAKNKPLNFCHNFNKNDQFITINNTNVSF